MNPEDFQIMSFSYVGIGLLVLLGAALQGVGGLGYALLCAPIAAIFYPELVPGPLLAIGAPLALMGFWRERKATEWQAASIAIAGRLIGTFIAIACLAYMSVTLLSTMFACLILVAVFMSTMGYNFDSTPKNMTIAGLLSGLMGTITSAGGPPLAIVMQSYQPPQLRATISAIFFVGTVISLIGLSIIGKMTLYGWLTALSLTPWMIIGFKLSNSMARRLSARVIRKWLLITSTMSAIGVLVKVWII